MIPLIHRSIVNGSASTYMALVYMRPRIDKRPLDLIEMMTLLMLHSRRGLRSATERKQGRRRGVVGRLSKLQRRHTEPIGKRRQNRSVLSYDTAVDYHSYTIS